MFSSSAYNKVKHGGHGTLVENWFEEEVMNDLTGERRNPIRSHIPKKHGELPSQTYADGSSTRIHGEKNDEFYSTYK